VLLPEEDIAAAHHNHEEDSDPSIVGIQVQEPCFQNHHNRLSKKAEQDHGYRCDHEWQQSGRIDEKADCAAVERKGERTENTHSGEAKEAKIELP
jgi:hypothetical protein